LATVRHPQDILETHDLYARKTEHRVCTIHGQRRSGLGTGMAALQLQSWQNHQTQRGAFLQEGAGREVFDLFTPVAPVPLLTEFTRQSLATPLPMIGSPLAQPDQFFATDGTALTNHFKFHSQLIAEGKEGVSNKIYRHLANAPDAVINMPGSSELLIFRVDGRLTSGPTLQAARTLGKFSVPPRLSFFLRVHSSARLFQ
jgi:hypothetical protein